MWFSTSAGVRTILISVALSGLCLTGHVRGQSIFTIAGGGTDDGRPATRAFLDQPAGIAVDSNGDIYFTDQDRIRRIDRATGLISTIAGGGTLDAENVRASSAALYGPTKLAFDPNGNLYYSEPNRNRVRRIDKETGLIRTAAGIGQPSFGFSGDGGPATRAQLYHPTGISLDGEGQLYICDQFNHRIRKVDAAGVISTIAEVTSNPGSILAGKDGSLLISHLSASYSDENLSGQISQIDLLSGEVTVVAGNGEAGFSGDGGPATEATLNLVSDIAQDPAGNIFLADYTSNRVRRIDGSSGIIETYAGNGRESQTMDGPSATSVPVPEPRILAVDTAGALLIGHSPKKNADGSIIRSVNLADHSIQTIVGGGGRGVNGPAPLAILGCPIEIAIGDATLYVGDPCAYRVWQIDRSTRVLSTLAGSGEFGDEGDGHAATSAKLSPRSIALDPGRTLYVADRSHDRVRAVDLVSGVITTVAGVGTPGFSGDGGPSTLASLDGITDIAVDHEGNLFIGEEINRRVRRVDADSGIITTYAGNGEVGVNGDGGPATLAKVNWPLSLAFDSSGNLIIGDTSYLRRVDREFETITTLLGPEAGLNFVNGVAIRRDGTIIMSTNNVVVEFDETTGALSRIAGSGEIGTAGDLGPATKASLPFPHHIDLDTTNGDLYIPSDNRIRLVPTCHPVSSVIQSSPSPGSSGVRTATGLVWEPVEYALRYDVYLDSVDPPRRIVASDIETGSLSVGSLLPFTTYYWKVIARGDPFCDPPSAAESEVWSFTTTSECSSPGRP